MTTVTKTYAHLSQVKFTLSQSDVQDAVEEYLMNNYEEGMIPGGRWEFEWYNDDEKLFVEMIQRKSKPIGEAGK